jgi:hypothetical protein
MLIITKNEYFRLKEINQKYLKKMKDILSDMIPEFDNVNTH